jgi:16S rRNA C1402 N4-methylase RsmH
MFYVVEVGLQDRIVKRFFQGKDRNESKVKFQYITDKFVKPSPKETTINPRSRSAILRVAEKLC